MLWSHLSPGYKPNHSSGQARKRNGRLGRSVKGLRWPDFLATCGKFQKRRKREEKKKKKQSEGESKTEKEMHENKKEKNQQKSERGK